MIDITENIIPIPPTATALGFFDGLHLGHMKVVEECFRHGGLCPAMFTFHSNTALPKREKIENLLTNDMKPEYNIFILRISIRCATTRQGISSKRFS